MSPIDSRIALLLVDVERDWSAVQTHLARAVSVAPGDSAPNAAYVALSLNHAYQAFETILLRIERSAGLPERTGDGWHRLLLADGAVALPGVRPPVYPHSVTRDWSELLAFRHFLRHAYHADLEPDRLSENVKRLARAVAATAPSVRALIDALSMVET